MVASLLSAPGNEEVQNVLKESLKLAQEGKMGYIFLVMVDGKQCSAGISGNINLENVCVEAVDKTLKDVLKPAQDNRATPERDLTLDASYAVYNVATGPASYDVIPWLIDREMNRIEKSGEAPLKVAFWFGKNGRLGLDTPIRKGLFEGVMKPAVELIGGTIDERAIYGDTVELYTTKLVEERARKGQKVPKLKAPLLAVERIRQWLSPFPKPVSITLRESAEWPHRNSNILEWIKFADYLAVKGYTPIFVRDTNKAFESPVSSYPECTQASLNLASRMALYELCLGNTFISNGPVNLALFSDVPWFMTMEIEADDSVYMPATRNFQRTMFLIDVEKGEQHTWQGPKQKFIPVKDTFENLKKAWEEVIEPL